MKKLSDDANKVNKICDDFLDCLQKEHGYDLIQKIAFCYVLLEKIGAKLIMNDLDDCENIMFNLNLKNDMLEKNFRKLKNDK